MDFQVGFSTTEAWMDSESDIQRKRPEFPEIKHKSLVVNDVGIVKTIKPQEIKRSETGMDLKSNESQSNPR